MADNNQNVATPDANSQPGAVQSLLSGLSAPMPAAPQVPQSPVEANTNKWAGLVQGALLGLAGGLKAGIQNINTAGTKNFQPANGVAAGEDEMQQYQQQQAQKQAAQQQQAQQQFDNQIKAGQFTQEQLLDRARLAKAHLDLYQQAQQLANLPAEQQQAHYAAEDARAAAYRSLHLHPVGDFDSAATALQYAQQHGKGLGDYNATHHIAADGTDHLTLWPTSQDKLDATAINKMLKSKDDYVPSGVSMDADDATAFALGKNAKYSDFLNQQTLQKQKDQAAMARTQVEQAGENARSQQKDNQTADPTLVDAIGTGHIAPERLTYLVARNPTLLQQVTQKYPDFDSSKAAAYPGVYNDFTHGKTSVALNSGATALKHLNELKLLNTSTSHLPGTPAYNAYQNKADTVATELARFYGDATVPAIASIKKTLTSTLPGNRDAAIRTQAQSMGDKFDSFEQQWKNAAPSASYQAAMPGIDNDALKARQQLDPRFQIASNPKTGQRIKSTDGGKTWQPLLVR